MKVMTLMGRLASAWTTVALFSLFGESWLAEPSSTSILLFLWLFAVILWCVFGVVEEADQLARVLGDPLGTLILTLSIVIVEVALIGAVVFGSDAAPTVGRDTMFAVLMLALNGVVGIALLFGGLHHHEQAYNLQEVAVYLAVIIPLSVFALILPNFTKAIPVGSLTATQAAFYSFFIVVLYGILVVIQAGRHRGFFLGPRTDRMLVAAAHERRHRSPSRTPGWYTLMIFITMMPIVLLAKQFAVLIDRGITVLGVPPALGGVLIALIVFTPGASTALRAALNNQLQQSISLSLGTSASIVGVTVPAILGIALIAEKGVILGLDPAGMTLLALTLMLSALTFIRSRVTVLDGMVHLILFVAYLVVVIFPPVK